MGGTKTDVDVTKDQKPSMVESVARRLDLSQTPSIGRVVHYVGSAGTTGRPEDFHFAADVVKVNEDHTLMLYVKNPNLRVAEFIGPVAEDQNGSERTWHWPERVSAVVAENISPAPIQPI